MRRAREPGEADISAVAAPDGTSLFFCPPDGSWVADFTPEAISLKFFRFNFYRQRPEDIDALKPFRVTELKRPG